MSESVICGRLANLRVCELGQSMQKLVWYFEISLCPNTRKQDCMGEGQRTEGPAQACWAWECCPPGSGVPGPARFPHFSGSASSSSRRSCGAAPSDVGPASGGRRPELGSLAGSLSARWFLLELTLPHWPLAGWCRVFICLWGAQTPGRREGCGTPCTPQCRQEAWRSDEVNGTTSMLAS